MKVSFLPCGDTGLTVEFGDEIDPDISAQVLGLDRRLACAGIAGVIETVPTFRSLLVCFDPLKLDPQWLQDRILELVEESGPVRFRTRRWDIPVCYEGPCAPDLDMVARRIGLTAHEVVVRHAAPIYHVYMLGFLPGFPYLGDVPVSLRLPRRSEPRLRVPAGSVAIATSTTAIYPVESPGGWHLIGRSPVVLFDSGRTPPALLSPGDDVHFYPLSARNYAALERDARAGRWVPHSEAADR